MSLNVNIGTAQDDEMIERDVFPLQTHDSRFYLVFLNQNETITVNVTSVYTGDFDIFIFNLSRPADTYINADGYEPQIFDLAAVYDINSGSSSSLQYTAINESIIYIQIVCIANGTDTYEITSEITPSRPWELNLYFIPFVPGFPIEFTAIFSVAAVVLMIQFHLKSKITKP
ncbi:MAG: hypothetical protein ACTSWY_02820 [Promethearchaeota archaeon]